MTALARDTWTVACGAAVSIAGIAAYRSFSPSPHGYLELFFAVPTIVAGLGVAGVALAFGAFPRPFRVAGWLLVSIAAIPILLAFAVFVSAVFDLDW